MKCLITLLLLTATIIIIDAYADIDIDVSVDACVDKTHSVEMKDRWTITARFYSYSDEMFLNAWPTLPQRGLNRNLAILPRLQANKENAFFTIETAETVFQSATDTPGKIYISINGAPARSYSVQIRDYEIIFGGIRKDNLDTDVARLIKELMHADYADITIYSEYYDGEEFHITLKNAGEAIKTVLKYADITL